MPELPVNVPAVQPEPSAPAPQPSPAPSPAPALPADPRSMDLKQLDAALSAAEKAQPAPGPAPTQAPNPQAQAQAQFDAQAEIAELKKMLRNQSKELGQFRKGQSDFSKLPETLDQLLAKREAAKEKARQDAAWKAQLTPEQRLALADQEAYEATQKKTVEELIQQKVEERLAAFQQEQQAPQHFVQGLEQMAGESYPELEPHLTDMAARILADITSQDPEKVEQALAAYDYYSANPGTLLWQASQMARRANPNGAAPAPAPAPQAAAPAPSPAQQFRQERAQASAAVSPQARSAAPNSQPTSLADYKPGDFLGMDKAKLDQLLTAAEGGRR